MLALPFCVHEVVAYYTIRMGKSSCLAFLMLPIQVLTSYKYQ